MDKIYALLHEHGIIIECYKSMILDGCYGVFYGQPIYFNSNEYIVLQLSKHFM